MVAITEIEELVVQLHKDGKSVKYIAKVVHKNFTYIGAVLKRRFPEEYATGNNTVMSIETQALKLLSEGKTPVEVAVLLNMKSEDTTNIYLSFLGLKRMYSTVKLLEKYKNEPKALWRLINEIKRSGLSLSAAATALGNKREIVEDKKVLMNINSEIDEKLNDLADLKMQELSIKTTGRPILSGSWPVW